MVPKNAGRGIIWGGHFGVYSFFGRSLWGRCGCKNESGNGAHGFSLRGFGECKPGTSTGVYGGDIYDALPRISHIGKLQLWNWGASISHSSTGFEMGHFEFIGVNVDGCRGEGGSGGGGPPPG